MKRMAKIRIMKRLNYFLNKQIIQFIFIIILGTLIIQLDYKHSNTDFDFSKYIDFTIITSVILTLVGSWCIGLLSERLNRSIEDSLKLD